MPSLRTRIGRWLRALPHAGDARNTELESPLRAELFSAEQMEEHGRTLAAYHQVQRGAGRNHLLARMDDNEAVLTDTCALLADAIRDDRRVTPASEWLLDNYYLIDEHLHIARRHFPKGYSWQLPRLQNGVSAGLPRIYDIALNAISHGDGRFDPESLHRFVAAYQRIAPLSLGELWAIPVMLRLALIENLRRVAMRVAQDRRDRDLAAHWGETMSEILAQDPKSLILAVADMARSEPPVSSSFVAELMQRLQGQNASLSLPVSWLEQRLAEAGLTIEQLVQSEIQQQAADQMSVSNSIGSLRLLLRIDWRRFVEGLSRTEAVLATDPAAVYTHMDFSTRDDYRHVVERLARKAHRPEEEVAQAAIQLARDALGKGDSAAAQSHVGYYLVGAGREALERICGLRPSLRYVPLPLYLGAMLALTIALVSLPAWALWHSPSARWLAVIGIILLLVAASQLSVVVVNWLGALLMPPQALPRLDYSAGIPAEALTVVAVPTMLDSEDTAREEVEGLEIRYLANRDAQLFFLLLTDFPDAASEHTAQDEAIIAVATQGIERLNQRYAGDGAPPFYLLHRPRRWNAGESAWMGEERKRGKLRDLNALLRGGGRECFSHIVGDVAALQNVRYVITLDADTQLPREAAHELVATLQHPLNRAHYDPVSHRVTRGYGILQPRLGATLSLGGASTFAALFGGEPGIDPYTRAVSDVYHDLFGEGSFTGKGIYDVDVFEESLAGRLADNRILSHDLLEGCYARSGLVSDVELFENFPQSYAADIKRRHRWIRGDWQISAWLWPKVRRADGSLERNPLSGLARWKIFDNLRRSLVAPAYLALLVLAWTVLAPATYWTAIVLQLVFVPVLVEALLATARKQSQSSWRQHVGFALRSAGRHVGQVLFTLACLPYEAMIALDAIVRTQWRQHVSHRRMLEWVPSRTVERAGDGSVITWVRRMALAPLAALIVGLAILHWQPSALRVAAPFLVLWLLAPVLAWRASQPPVATQSRLALEHEPFLRDVARRTWHFFDRYVGAGDNWLPPDNYQEMPGDVIAHRTSPTNIGLSLLANLAASDFGYICVRRLLERTQATFDTLDKLERYRGHFFNWYDTQSLAPLQPRYISTVDSGNLAGHLLTLRQGLLGLENYAPCRGGALAGLVDTASVLLGLVPAALQAAVSRFVREAREAEGRRRESVSDVGTELNQLLIQAKAVADAAATNTAAAAWAQSLLRQCADAIDELAVYAATPGGTLSDAAQSSPLAAAWLQQARDLARRAAEFAVIEYDFLYDNTRDLFSIGFNLNDHRRDAGYYDLLASEARLGVFVAVAQGRVPQRSWFSLGRLLTESSDSLALLSWSGSMFEYLMPNLVMPSYAGSLLDQTCRAAVARQIAYGREREVPWGISECGYFLTDAAQNYQYRAFGVPGLGLQRGLSQELVIAPYACALGLLTDPNAAATNLRRMAEEGWLTPCGFYEAVDFTPSRVVPGQRHAVVRSFMAHHQGMSLLAIAHVLFDRPMQHRFESDPQVQSALLLLQERVPRATGQAASDPKLVDARNVTESPATPLRVFNRPDPATPAVQLLSNGRYHVMLSSAGGGYSRWRDTALTRWREDPTRDDWGSYVYLRDVDQGTPWSTTFQPTLEAGDSYEAVFTEARVEYRRRVGHWETHTEVVVSPEDDIELRRTRITNRDSVARVIEVTSFAEVVLAPSISDELHPAFSKLFVQTEIIEGRDAIVCSRRPRDSHDTPPWMLHVFAVHEGKSQSVSFETDRAKFLGRHGTAANAAAILRGGKLSGSQGSVLDPVVAIRHRIRVEPEKTVIVDAVLGIGSDREQCLALVDKYHDRRLADRVIDLAWTHSQVSLRQINVSEAEAQTYARLAGRLLYSHPSLRADAQQVIRNRRGQPALWAYAVSGDLPIVLVQVGSVDSLNLVRDAVQAHAYWRMKGLAADLVILNEERGGYRQNLNDALMGLIAGSVEASALERSGGIFVRAAEQIPHEDRLLLLAVARIVLDDKKGSLGAQLQRREPSEPLMPRLVPREAERRTAIETSAKPLPALRLDNGRGGFSEDAREYVIVSRAGDTTPLPWVNVIANPSFGCIVSESGAGYTWRENAHEYRLTPWLNDPVSDGCGEAFYVRDDESGRYFSPAALPARGSGDYVTRHGFGYSIFEHAEDGIQCEQRVYVATDAEAKFIVLRLRNVSGRRRALSATGYVEWVLGDLAAKSGMHVVTELDPRSGALFARNAFHPEFGEWVSFFDVDEPARTLTGDRLEFIGRNGQLSRPAAMERMRLSGRVGALMNPCGAIQIPFELEDGQSREIIFRLGAAANADAASNLVQRLRRTGYAREALTSTKAQWADLLGAVQIETPDPSLDALANGWLLYQVIACRMWARSGYYQSGGAFGFRDQLQDTMALVHAAPQMLRDQLLLCASRQFKEGDVQHWWHPPAGRGVRTRCSDDFLWLPLAACRYVNTTGDAAVLDEMQPFLDGRLLNEGEESYYDLPLRWDEPGSLYVHCQRAIEHGLRMGPHGLPLIGSGDWNDGMNNVGIHGQGESVWLGFFLYRILLDFAPIARQRGDGAFASHCEEEAEKLRDNLQEHAWDGAWYRRAYFDDGTPLGSSSNQECQIDSIAQSWAVLSGAAPDERARQALDALKARLVKTDAGLIQLLDPPFDTTPLDPGYIRGYVPGVRENGGQYTHAAIWAVMAMVEAGRNAEAWELFDLINPLRHGADPDMVEKYKVEPYVVAADVYAVPPHTGRGGWTWYTGSAGWMYRLIVESLLGIRREGAALRIAPRLPAHWPGFRFSYRYGESTYRFQVIADESAQAKASVLIPLLDDGNGHDMEVRIARS